MRHFALESPFRAKVKDILELTALCQLQFFQFEKFELCPSEAAAMPLWSIFALNTKGAWILRFGDILADALELGPLQNHDISLPQEILDLLAERTPKGVPDTLLPMLAKYYLTHLQESEDWVVLPVSAVDAYYGGSHYFPKT